MIWGGEFRDIHDKIQRNLFLIAKRTITDVVAKPNLKTVNNQTKEHINSYNDAIKIKLMYFKNFPEIYIQIII